MGTFLGNVALVVMPISLALLAGAIWTGLKAGTFDEQNRGVYRMLMWVAVFGAVMLGTIVTVSIILNATA